MPAVAWLRQNTIGSLAAGSRQQPVGVELAVRAAVRVRGREIAEVRRHHARADGAAPPRRGVGGRPQTRVAKRLLGRGERETVRAVRELPLLPVDEVLVVEILHFGGDAHRESAGVEEADLGAAAAAGEQRIPCRRDVVADRRDEADAGDGHTSFARSRLTLLRAHFEPRGGGGLAVHPRREREPSRSRRRRASARRRCRAAAPGGMNERIFTCVIREGAGRVPAGQCVASARDFQREADLRVEQKRRRKDGTAREMIAEERGRFGHVQRRARRHARHAAVRTTCGSGTPWKRPGVRLHRG